VGVTSIVLPRTVAHARQELPNECCGLLVGLPGLVRAAVPMRNVLGSPTQYRIDDAEHMALRRTLRHGEEAVEILGVYHSHPSGSPDPSPTDVAQAHYPDWVYVIVGCVTSRPVIGAYTIAHGQVSQVTLGAGAPPRA
jgi:[CysO sulfur-carrier protein]-S-L-cysteine hydrolase